jgi:hypothetical protein
MALPYSTLVALQNKLSVAGVTLRLDDASLPDSDDADVLGEADDIIHEHLLERYTEANLDASTWVLRAATRVACVLLCERRGNPCPSSIMREYERYMKRLEDARIGRFNLPDVPMREACVPVMSNQRPVLRPHPRMVTEKRKSTGRVTDYTQKRDYMESEPSDYVL